MLSKELKDFIDKVDLFLRKTHLEKKGNYNKIEDIFAGMIKVTEEVGELSNEVLAFSNYQRKEKADKHNQETLESEFADVLFSLLVLAKTMDVNMDEAVTKKMQKIKERFNLD